MNSKIRAEIAPVCPEDRGQLIDFGRVAECSQCGRHFEPFDGILDLLPKVGLESSSIERSQLNDYTSIFSGRKDLAAYRMVRSFLDRLGNGYLYSWVSRNIDTFSSGQSQFVLDAACGDGILSRYLPISTTYVGIDFSPRVLLRAKRWRRGSYFRADLA